MKLLHQYVWMHQQGHFPGNSTAKWSDDIKAMVEKHEVKTMLDYGCGKGLQYYDKKLHNDWGIEMPALYEPAVPQLDDRNKLRTLYDAVICTDVLEHLESIQLYTAVKDCLSCASKAVFFSITCRPAKKTLPDGRNAHITIQPPIWWRGYIAACRDSGFGFEGLDIILRFEE